MSHTTSLSWSLARASLPLVMRCPPCAASLRPPSNRRHPPWHRSGKHMEEALGIIADLADGLLLDIEDRAAAGRYAIAAQSGGAAGFEALLSLARLVGEAADAN